MKYLSSVLIILLPLTLWAQDTESVPKVLDYNDGYAEGQVDGEHIDQKSWMAYGCGGGFLLGCLGGGGVWLLAGSGDNPKVIPEGPGEFRRGYIDGYKDATKSKKQQNALIGGLVGTAVAVVIIVLAYPAE